MENQVTGRSLLAQIISDLELQPLATDRLTQAFEAQLNAGIGTDRVLAAVVSQIPGVKQKAEEAGIELGEFVSDAVAEATDKIEAGEGVELPDPPVDPEEPDTGDTDRLTSALANLAKANKDVEDFLAAQEFSYGEGDGAVEVKKGEATKASIKAAVTYYENIISSTVDGDDDGKFVAAGPATKLGLIEDTIAKLDKAIEDAEKELAAAKLAASSTLTAIAAVESRTATYEKDYAANEAAKLAVTGKTAEIEALAGNEQKITEVEESTEGEETAPAQLKLGEKVIAESVDGKWVAAKETSDVKGLTDFLTAKNAAIDAQAKLDASTKSLKEAIADVINLENKGKEGFTEVVGTNIATPEVGITGTAEVKFKAAKGGGGGSDTEEESDAPFADKYLTAREELSDARDDLASFKQAISSLSSFNEIKKALNDLNAKVTAAENHIKDADTGLGITLISGGASFTSGDDAYLFNETESADKTLTGFGQEGDDKIYLGDSYDGGLVEITDVKNSNGALDKKEVFWEQDGDNVNLYVEQTTFAGNGTTEADMVKLTLSGVKGDDLRLDDDGYLSLA